MSKKKKIHKKLLTSAALSSLIFAETGTFVQAIAETTNREPEISLVEGQDEISENGTEPLVPEENLEVSTDEGKDDENLSENTEDKADEAINQTETQSPTSDKLPVPDFIPEPLEPVLDFVQQKEEIPVPNSGFTMSLGTIQYGQTIMSLQVPQALSGLMIEQGNSIIFNNMTNVAAQAPEAPADWLVHTGNYDWSIVDSSGALVPNISVQSIRGDLSLTLTGNGTASVAVQRRAGIQITDTDSTGTILPAGTYTVQGLINNQVLTGGTPGTTIDFTFTVLAPPTPEAQTVNLSLVTALNASKVWDGSSSLATGVAIPAVTADTMDVTSLPALTASDFVYVSDSGNPDGSVGSVLTLSGTYLAKLKAAYPDITFNLNGLRTNITGTILPISHPDLTWEAGQYNEDKVFDGTADLPEDNSQLPQISGLPAGISQPTAADFIYESSNAGQTTIVLRQKYLNDLTNNGVDVSNLEAPMFTGTIQPLDIQIRPGILQKPFNNAITMDGDDFAIDENGNFKVPVIINQAQINATQPVGQPPITLSQFVDSSMTGLRFIGNDPHIVGNNKAFAESSTNTWGVILSHDSLASNFTVSINGKNVWTPALAVSADNPNPQANIPIDVTELVEASIVKSPGPELMWTDISADVTQTSATLEPAIALDMSGQHNRQIRWTANASDDSLNGINQQLWQTEINVQGQTGIQYLLYARNPNFATLSSRVTTETPLQSNTTGHFTGLSPNTKYYVVATSLESQNFYQGPPTTTAYEFTTLSNSNETTHQPTPPAQEGAGNDNLPQAGTRSSIVGLLGAAALTLASAIFTLRRYRK